MGWMLVQGSDPIGGPGLLGLMVWWGRGGGLGPQS